MNIAYLAIFFYTKQRPVFKSSVINSIIGFTYASFIYAKMYTVYLMICDKFVIFAVIYQILSYMLKRISKDASAISHWILFKNITYYKCNRKSNIIKKQ